VEKTMSKKIAIATAVAFFIGSLFAPPDVASQLTLGIMAAFVCAGPLLILARVAFVRAASPPMHTLVCVLVCIVSVLSMFSFLLVLRVTQNPGREPSPPAASSRP
jgi:O-antigen ligase